MEIPQELARAAQEHRMAAGRNAAVDDLTTAIMTGASPSEISRLESSGENGSTNEGDGAYDGQDANANAEGRAGDLPSGEPRNAERIRLTGLEERDKGLVNAANIIARTERIPFDEAWQRVNGITSHEQNAQQAMSPQYDDGAQTDALPHDALREHSLQLAGHLFDDLRNPESAHWREANRIATDPSHPDYDAELLTKPHAPLIVAKLAAANLAMRNVTARGQGPGRDSAVRPAAATKQSAPPPLKRSAPEIARASEQAALDAIEGRVAPSMQQAQRGYLRL